MYPHCLARHGVDAASRSRGRASACRSAQLWPGGPCPMLLTPRMAYQREFFGDGTVHVRACRRDLPHGVVPRARWVRRSSALPSDMLFWMRACTTMNVLLLPADLFWYRVHRTQAVPERAGAARLRAARPAWSGGALDAPECPLTPDEREQAKRNRAYHLAKRTLQDLRRGRWRFALERLRHSNMTHCRLAPLSAASEARTRSPARRFGPDGDFVTPDWTKSEPAVTQKR